MKKTFKQQFLKVILIFLFGFATLFVFRLIYGYTKKVNTTVNQIQFFQSINNLRNNYASKEYKVKGNISQAPATKIDQKYEKVAAVNSTSSKFEEEEKLLRKSIEENDALIQFEQKNGNEGNQKLHLMVGVPPEKFDALYRDLIKIGKVQSKEITKKDKTNEYKELNAKKASLEKTRTSLISLKSKGGKIEEYINLENQILEIERQLQALGVNLGDFDDENEFCTIKFSLIEGKEVKISLMHRVKVALEWSIKIYFRIMATLFFLTLAAYMILLIIDRFKILENLYHKNIKK